MGSDEIVGLLVTILVMLMGMLGAVVPVLPGPPLIFLAALVHRLWFGERSVDWWVVSTLGAMAVLVTALDFLASTYGAKRFGASWKGMVGAGLGAVVGIFWIPPIGLFLGPFIGAFLAEWVGGRDWSAAGKAGIGAAIGVVLGAIGKLVACTAMIGWWVFAMIRHHPW